MIRVVEHQDALLERWRQADSRGLRLVHVDFHDDLRGLVIDRKRGLAYAVRRGVQPGVDAGNYLAHAVMEGRVSALRWVHGTPGGRGWDLAEVRYHDDVRALGDRLARRLSGARSVPLRFSEGRLEQWDGVREGEELSIDWDCFASFFQDASTIADRIEAFFAGLGATRPATTTVAYSSGCVPPNLEAFRAFVERLSRTLAAPLEWVSPGLLTGELRPLDDVETTLPKSRLKRLMLLLRRHGLG